MGIAKQDVSVTQTFDVADRIIARWKENLARLNAEEPLPKTIEGTAVDVTARIALFHSTVDIVACARWFPRSLTTNQG